VTRQRFFHELDAGEQREFLACELARWSRARYWSQPRVRGFNRRLAMAARRLGMKREDYLVDLRADADAILADPDCDTILDT